MSNPSELQLRLEQEAHISSAKLAAFELATSLGLPEEVASGFVETFGVKAGEQSSEDDQSGGQLMSLAKILGWQVRGYPPVLPIDSNVNGYVVFDSRTDNGPYASIQENKDLAIHELLTSPAKRKLHDARTGQVVRFVGRLFDETYGFSTPSLVMSGEEALDRAELRHLDFGTILKARIIGMNIHAIAKLTNFSRPTVHNIQDRFMSHMAEQLPSDHPSSVLNEVMTGKEEVRIIARYRSVF